jgi:hypothetical protein
MVVIFMRNHVAFVSLVAAILLVAACRDEEGARKAPAGKGIEERAKPDSQDCRVIGEKAEANVVANIPADAEPSMRARLEQLGRDTGQTVRGRCEHDRWSADAVTCGLAAKDVQLECGGVLTVGQRKLLGDDLQATWTARLSTP